MPAWFSPLAIIIAGAIGGVTNAFMTQNGFALPAKVRVPGGAGKIWQPGILGNVSVSAIAALVSWGLYGAGAALPVFTTSSEKDPGLTYSALVGAILIGVGGARWLTAEVDKALLRGAAVSVANKAPDDTLVSQLAVSSPSEAYAAAISAP